MRRDLIDHHRSKSFRGRRAGPRGVFAALFHRLTSTERDRIDEILKLIRLDANVRGVFAVTRLDDFLQITDGP